MINRRHMMFAGVAGAAAVIAANAGIGLARTADRVSSVSGRVQAQTAIDLNSWTSAARLPILPAEGLTTVREGQQIAIGVVDGLAGVAARLNGTKLDVSRQENDFVITVGAIEGTGAAELIIDERFADGSVLSVPFTVYSGAGTLAVGAPAVESAQGRSTTIISWKQLGRSSGVEGDIVGPQAVAALADGRIAILDTINGRVAVSDGTGEISTIAQLPTESFSALVTSHHGAQLLAIDLMSGQAIDVTSGETFTLPPFMRGFPLGVDFALDDEGTLYVTNPGDNEQYSIGRLTANGFDAAGVTSRHLDAPRTWVIGTTLNVQSSALAKPTSIDFGNVDAVSVFDSDRLDDGRVVVLVGTVSKDKTETKILTIDGGSVTSRTVDFSSAMSMTRPMTVSGNTVTIASDGDGGLALTSIQV